MRTINVFSNNDDRSLEVKALLKRKLEKSDFVVPGEFDEKAELIICIGGGWLIFEYPPPL
jgi:hypothetical protein